VRERASLLEPPSKRRHIEEKRREDGIRCTCFSLDDRDSRSGRCCHRPSIGLGHQFQGRLGLGRRKQATHIQCMLQPSLSSILDNFTC